MNERELLKTIRELEERIEALENKVYGEKPSDMIVCDFEDVIVEPRWKNTRI